MFISSNLYKWIQLCPDLIPKFIFQGTMESNSTETQNVWRKPLKNEAGKELGLYDKGI